MIAPVGTEALSLLGTKGKLMRPVLSIIIADKAPIIIREERTIFLLANTLGVCIFILNSQQNFNIVAYVFQVADTKVKLTRYFIYEELFGRKINLVDLCCARIDQCVSSYHVLDISLYEIVTCKLDLKTIKLY